MSDVSENFHARGMLAGIRVLHRERMGEGQPVSLLDGVVFSMIAREGEYWQTRQEPPRLGTAHPSFAPCQAFGTRDGRFVFVSGDGGSR